MDGHLQNGNEESGQSKGKTILDLIENIIQLKPLAEQAKDELQTIQNVEANDVKDKKIREVEDRIKRRDSTIHNMKRIQTDKEHQIQALRQELKTATAAQEMNSTNASNTDGYDNDINTYQSELKTQESEILNIKEQLRNKCTEAEQQETAYKNEIEQIQGQLAEKDSEVQELQDKINTQAAIIEDGSNTETKIQRSSNTLLEGTPNDKIQILTSPETEDFTTNANSQPILELQDEIKRRDTTIENMTQVQTDKDKEIQELRQELRSGGAPQDMSSYMASQEDRREHDLKAHQSDIDAKDRQIQSIKEQLRDKCSEVDDNRRKIRQIQDELREKEIEIKELQQKISTQDDIIDEENKDLRTESCVNEIADLKKQLEDARTESDRNEKRTKTGSSKFMDNNVSNQNHNVTTERDENTPTQFGERYENTPTQLGERYENTPTQLGERFEELYDQTWKEAFEIVMKYSKTELECVETLIKVLMAAKKFCITEVKKQEAMLKEALLLNGHEQDGLFGYWHSFLKAHTYSTTQFKELKAKLPNHSFKKYKTIPDHINKQLKDYRKELAVINVPEIYESFLVSISKSSHEGRVMLLLGDYVRECIELCWLMSLQEPPVVFGQSTPRMAKFDTTVFRSYKMSGTSIEFVVWPPVYIYEGGPLICKGVAEGCESKKSQTNIHSRRVYESETDTDSSRLDKTTTTNYGMKRNKQSERRTDISPDKDFPDESYLQRVVPTNMTRTIQPFMAEAASYEDKRPVKNDWEDFKYFVNNHYSESYAKMKLGNKFNICRNWYIKRYGLSPIFFNV